MSALWQRTKVIILVWAYLARTTNGKAERDTQQIGVYQDENVTLIWSVPHVTEPRVVSIQDDMEKEIIKFRYGKEISKRPFVERAGDGTTTFGFTIHNVKLHHAGVYQCIYEGTRYGMRICFVWGAPEKAKVSQVGGRLICEANPTSLPAAYRSPMKFRWYSRGEQSSNTTQNYTSEDQDILVTYQAFQPLTQSDHGDMFCCAGSENGSSLWSERSDWYQPFFPTVAHTDTEESNTSITYYSAPDDNKFHGLDPFTIIISLVSFSAVLLVAVVIGSVIMCRRKKSKGTNQNAANNHKMAANDRDRYCSDEEDSTVLVDNTEYSDVCFGSDGSLGEYADIREIERLRIKDRAPAPLPDESRTSNVYELQQSVQMSDEQAAKSDDTESHDELRIVTDIYAVPMKKSTLK